MDIPHGYAKQYLNGTDFEIYVGEDKILKYNGKPNYSIPDPYQTVIEVGQSFGDEKGEYEIITSYGDLSSYGFVIVSRNAELYEKVFKGQSKHYELARKGVRGFHILDSMPNEHWVRRDVLNKALRLEGQNAGRMGRIGRGAWVFLEPKKAGYNTKERTFKDYLYKSKDILKDIFRSHMPIEEEPQYKYIPEVLFMISKANELVCIEHEHRDPPVIGMVGQRAGGKTVLLHGMMDQIHYKTEDPEDPLKGHRMVMFNDRQQQFPSWSRPTESTLFIRANELVNHYPTPLPCVFLFPHNVTLDSLDIDYGSEEEGHILEEKEGVSFRITLPYEGIVEDHKYFFEGRDNWNLGQSERYFKQNKEYLKMAKTIDQTKAVLQEKLLGISKEGKTKSKGLRGSVNKIMAVMEDLYDTQIMDVNTDYPSKWTVFHKRKKIGDYFPISALLSARLIPIVENGNLYTKDYYPQYMRFLINDLYENLLQKRLPYKDRTWEFVDEIGQIYKKNKRRTVAAECLVDTFTEGRKPNLGAAYTLQSWNQVDDEIRLNSSHVISFNLNQPKDLSELSSSFSLPKHLKEEIKTLKTFECVAMTTKRFKVYDSDGNAYHTDEPIKGKIVFPTSEHTKPA